MDLKCCENNHYYDGDRYATCPHCMVAGGVEETASSELCEEGVEALNNAEYSRPSLDDETVAMPEEVWEEDCVCEEAKDEQSISVGSLQQQTDDMGVTVGFFAEELVVGWLVAVKGEHRGEFFPLKEGMNHLGRSTQMDICLMKDSNISRNRHVTLIYDAKNSEFVIYMGESKELVYVNDELLLNPTKLKARDEIMIGKSVLVFVPFCGKEFRWE